MQTFFELSGPLCDRERSRFHIIPVPYEATVCFQKGTQYGPEAILAVSDQLEHFDEELLQPIPREGVYTWPPVESADMPEEEMARIERFLRGERFFADRRFPILLGGEHSITPPIVRVAAEHYPHLSVLQFDAHSDLRDHFTHGGKFSHASAMRRVLEVTPHLVQVGIRSFSEEDVVACPVQVENFVTPGMIEENADRALARILDRLTADVYITFDMDALDPSFAPGVGTPEPGGLAWRTATRILREVSAAKHVVGADVVETMPIAGNQLTEFVAARVVAKIISYNSKSGWDRK
ncbi:MAG: agmatinase [Planctomycetia bacterium]|nr:agmatinase [Planctomycetia bacterium]